uniref:Ubiquitin conjugation factor E4 A n=1 Tax=Timema californicum TaxID=61474 RepID=A0A7R9IZG8_TIMCA|nr:unnamed protein product [Timema californicum]
MEATTPPLFLRFINLLMNDAVFLLDESLNNMAQLRTMQTARDAGEWADVREQTQNERLMMHTGMIARFDNILGRETIHILELLTSEITSIFCHPTMVERIASMLNYFLYHLVGPNKKNFKVKDQKEYEFDPANTVLNICKIYVHLVDSDAFCSAVSQDGRSYSPQLFSLAEDVLVRIGGASLISDLQTVASKVSKLATQYQTDEAMLSDAPEEFLDPIMSTLMLDPVILPSSRTTVDRSTIARHLLSDQSDPFNRAPLTMDMAKAIVEHYSRSPSTRKRLHTVMEEMVLPVLELIQFVDTRWSSEYNMLSRLHAVRKAVGAELANSENNIEILTEVEWKQAAGIVEVLGPLADATKEISGDNKALKSRFSFYDSDPIFCPSMLCDPRFRGVLIDDMVAVNTLAIEVKKLSDKSSLEPNVKDEHPSCSSSSSGLWSSFDSIPNTTQPAIDNNSEVKDYLNEPRIRSNDLLKEQITAWLLGFSIKKTVNSSWLTVFLLISYPPPPSPSPCLRKPRAFSFPSPRFSVQRASPFFPLPAIICRGPPLPPSLCLHVPRSSPLPSPSPRVLRASPPSSSHLTAPVCAKGLLLTAPPYAEVLAQPSLFPSLGLSLTAFVQPKCFPPSLPPSCPWAIALFLYPNRAPPPSPPATRECTPAYHRLLSLPLSEAKGTANDPGKHNVRNTQSRTPPVSINLKRQHHNHPRTQGTPRKDLLIIPADPTLGCPNDPRDSPHLTHGSIHQPFPRSHPSTSPITPQSSKPLPHLSPLSVPPDTTFDHYPPQPPRTYTFSPTFIPYASQKDLRVAHLRNENLVTYNRGRSKARIRFLEQHHA